MNYQLYLGDCLEIMPTLDTGSITAIVTDPPYGIGINKSHRLSTSRGFSGQTWDDDRATDAIKFILDFYGERPLSIWGGNYYADILPASRGWLVWDKNNDGRDFGEAELAWTNKDDVIRVFEKRPMNMDGGKVHPTQKPIDLMVWNIDYLELPRGSTILDPFGGSGSTGCACAKAGYNFIGIERDPGNFAIMRRRVELAAAQPLLPGM